MLQPHLLIQSGCYNLDNLGEVSMIRSALGRLGERIPGARYSVPSRNVDGVQSLSPRARAVAVENRSDWKLVRSLYLSVRAGLPSVDPFLRSNFPRIFHLLLRLKARQLTNRELLLETDFVIVSGGGYFTDAFAAQAWSSLERIRAADSLGIPFALVGQSFGPLTDPALRRAFADLLPRARLIAVRERRGSVPFLRELGVSEERVVVTGDDAVEDAWRGRADDIGSSIGVNLRVAPYAGTSYRDVDVLREGLRATAAATQAELVALPICIAQSVESSSDAIVTDRVIAGLPEARDKSALPTSVGDLISRVAACRVVITGSYHAAVFALSQGIPAVCVFNSEYYEMKFLGLRNMFGAGCEVISMSNDRCAERISAASLEMWRAAPSLRPLLLSAAEEQIAAGHRAYDELCSIIAAECAHSPRSRADFAA